MHVVEALFKNVIVQIATPYSTGTGFLLSKYNIIVTNEHIVRDNKEVVIDGALFTRQMAQVVFSDAKYDLAFLSAPENVDGQEVKLASEIEMQVGDQVLALGHPLGMPFESATGTVMEVQYLQDNIPFVRHSATLAPGYSGGPLVNKKGEVLGVNTFLTRNNQNIGFCLPARFLKQLADEFEAAGRIESVRCLGCAGMILATNVTKNRCPDCGIKLVHPSKLERYEPNGIAKTIEEMLHRLEHQVNLSRRGPNNWEIRQGSAKIDISYYEKSGLIIGDAYLCKVPASNFQAICEYLLRMNDELQNLTFSIKDDDIVLSVLIFDRYLNVDTGIKLFQHLFKRADHFDNILVEKYGAAWDLKKE